MKKNGYHRHRYLISKNKKKCPSFISATSTFNPIKPTKAQRQHTKTLLPTTEKRYQIHYSIIHDTIHPSFNIGMQSKQKYTNNKPNNSNKRRYT